jgi:surface protein
MKSVTVCRLVAAGDGTDAEIVVSGVAPFLFVLLLSCLLLLLLLVFLSVGYLILEQRRLIQTMKDTARSGSHGTLCTIHTTPTRSVHCLPGGRNPPILPVPKRYFSLPDELVLSILSHLDVITLIGKKRVCRKWRQMCNGAIDAKQTSATKKAVMTNTELREAVTRYCSGNPDVKEEIAQTYGWPINKWDVSNLKVFSQAFASRSTFNEDISSWDVSHATTMVGMFSGASAFNRDISNWNVSNVRDMQDMFFDATSFNQNLSDWDVSKVTHMGAMFSIAKAFNKDISNWDVSNVRNMDSMFSGAATFNQNISHWNVSRVTSMISMFRDAAAFNQNLSNWNVTNVRYMAHMFQEATSFHQDVSSWGWNGSLFEEDEEDLALLGF